jgi:hypothetical protein
LRAGLPHGEKAGVVTAEAHAITLGLIGKNLIFTAKATAAMLSGDSVASSLTRYIWKRMPESQNPKR